ncbi:MAG: sulfotransferase [Candidatus Promineofilum sp.]|nr:sulfotransferase [Promineifilum sp.]
MPQTSLRKQATRRTMRAVHTLRHRAMDAGLLPGQTGYTRFLCVGYARSGSTLLMRSLNNHSRIVGYGEIVKNVDRYPQHYHEFESSQALFERDPARFLQTKVFRAYPPNVAAVGFKIFYHHAPRDTVWGRAVWEYLLGQPELRVLHLKRRNWLKMLVSEKQAGETEEWIKYSDGQEAPAVHLPPDEAAAFFARVAAWEAEYDALFAGHPGCEVVYEQLTRDLPGQLARIQTFLDVPHEAVSPGTAKRPRRALAEQITNYAELKGHFAATPWAAFFTE